MALESTLSARARTTSVIANLEEVLKCKPSEACGRSQFLNANWLREIERARRRADRNRFFFRALRFLAVAGALILPAFAALGVAGSGWTHGWTFAVSLVVALATSGLQVFRFGTQWSIDEEYANALEAQGWAYFQSMGPYTGTDAEAYKKFFDKLQELRRQRDARQMAEIVAAAQEATQGSPAGESPKAQDKKDKKIKKNENVERLQKDESVEKDENILPPDPDAPTDKL